MNQLDHVVIAAPDLNKAKQAMADQTGVMPIDGGPHLGMGSRNALLSFGNGSYLEIIAPDPDQNLSGNFGAVLADLKAPELLHWAIRTDDLTSVAQAARKAGFTPGDIRETSRRTPSGEVLKWKLLGIAGHSHGGFVPFYIDWLDCVHPS
ncbi:MAG: VOC family protein, partial [Proteobacteria bacterium]|nr:VOC family protein [Pseudomonadota bacterium]